MKVTTHDDGKITADICLTHYGHETELQHLNIPNGVRQQIAAKLKQGVRTDKILDNIRDSVGEKFNREHLVEEQDIRNIAIAFGISETRRHDNDQESVEVGGTRSYRQITGAPCFFLLLTSQRWEKRKYFKIGEKIKCFRPFFWPCVIMRYI